MSTVIKTLIPILGSSLAICVIARAQCPVNSVIIKGRVVENANAHSKVRVQLVYPKEKPGESGEVTVEDGAFQITDRIRDNAEFHFHEPAKEMRPEAEDRGHYLAGERSGVRSSLPRFCQELQDGRS